MNAVLSPTQNLLMQEVNAAWEYIKQNDHHAALKAAQQASVISPDSPYVHHLLGILASRDGRADLALPLLQKALEGGLTEQRLRHMAEALLSAGHARAALAPIQDAIKHFGDTSETLGLLAAVQVALNDYKTAGESAEKAVALKPHAMAWDSTVGFCKLIQKQMTAGFKALTGRAENLPAGSRAPALQFSQACDIWLKNEQGPGDTIFNLRFAPALVKKGFKLHIQTDKKTKALLRDTGLFASVKEEIQVPHHGFWLNVGDLPLAGLQVGAEETPPPLALKLDASRVEKMRAKLAAIGPAPYIAVSWRGGPRGKKQRNGLSMFSKNVPPLALGQALSHTQGTVISLQRVPEADENQAFKQGLGRDFVDFSSYNDHLQDMLALLSLVDLYVAVPNTNVHLRESIAKPSFILVNRPWQDWRWLAEGNSPWYPNSTVLRQAENGSWDNALHEITKHSQTITGKLKQDNVNRLSNINVSAAQDEHCQQLLKTGWSAVNEGDVASAIKQAQMVLAQSPDNAEALHLLGWAAHRDLKTDLAVNILRRAVELAATNGRILGDLVRVLTANRQAHEALNIANQALADDTVTSKSSIFYARATVNLQLVRLPEAIADFENTLKLSPNSLDALAYCGMTRLKLGDARNGFREYSARTESRLETRRDGHVCPWLRGNVSGLKVLIRRDMGLGDELTYLRYLPWLEAAGVEVTYWCGTKLAPILKRMDYAKTIIADQSPLPNRDDFDLAIWVHELPVAVEALNSPEIAPPLPLTPRQDLLDKWQAWLEACGPAPYFGINWRAGAAAEGAASVFSKLAKAVDKKQFAHTLSDVNGTFISLQRNVMHEEMQHFEQVLGCKIHDAAALTDDLEDLLALLSLLDENIGVSNTNMHLRAGLGKASRVLVQTPGGDWRWGHEGKYSPWFTTSIVYRQNLGGDWSHALQDLRQDLIGQYGELKKHEKRQTLKQTKANTQVSAKKVIWLTAGSIVDSPKGKTSNLASTRYRVIQPANSLTQMGWQCEFINESFSEVMGGWGSSVPQAGNVLVVSKVFTDHALKLAKDAKARGAKVVVDFCDNFLDHPKRGALQQALLALADNVVASTTAMAEALNQHGKSAQTVIADPIEFAKGDIKFKPKKSLKLLWFGHAVNLDTLAQFLPQLAKYATSQSLSLNVVTTLTNGAADLEKITPQGLKISYTPWSVEATQQAIADCDLVIIPTIANDFKKAKSANRLLEPLWAGRMVVAGPLPAYLPFADSAWIGKNLIEGITWAIAHPAEVKNRIKQGQQDIACHFTQEVIGKQWSQALSAQAECHEPLLVTSQNAITTKKLNLGCGDKISDGYINVDVELKKCIVVISYYDKRPIDDLHALINTIDTYDPGFAIELAIVVNQEAQVKLETRSTKFMTHYFYRNNEGMNIGAWDYGWRQFDDADCFIFLQDECRILRDDWVIDFLEKLKDPSIGLIGEAINQRWNKDWTELIADENANADIKTRANEYLAYMKNNHINSGENARHLRSLIWACKATTLKQIDGFPIGRSLNECIAAEISVSKQIEHLGLKVIQLDEKNLFLELRILSGQLIIKFCL